MLSQSQVNRVCKLLGKTKEKLPATNKKILNKVLSNLKTLLSELPNNSSVVIDERDVRHDIRYMANQINGIINSIDDDNPEYRMSDRDIRKVGRNIKNHCVDLSGFIVAKRKEYEEKENKQRDKNLGNSKANKGKKDKKDKKPKETEQQKRLRLYKKRRKQLLLDQGYSEEDIDAIDAIETQDIEEQSEEEPEQSEGELGEVVEKNISRVGDLLDYFRKEKRRLPENVEPGNIKVIQMSVVAFTKPGRIAQGRINKVDFGIHPLYPGYLFENQTLVAFHRDTDRDDAIKMARQQLGKDRVDVLTNDVFSAKSTKNINFVWLVPKDTYQELGGFTAIKVSFPFEFKASDFAADNSQKTELAQKRHELDAEIEKRTERPVRQQRKINKFLENQKYQIASLREEYKSLEGEQSEIFSKMKHISDKTKLNELRMQLKELERKKTSTGNKIDKLMSEARAKRNVYKQLDEDIEKITGQVRQEMLDDLKNSKKTSKSSKSKKDRKVKKTKKAKKVNKVKKAKTTKRNGGKANDTLDTLDTLDTSAFLADLANR